MNYPKNWVETLNFTVFDRAGAQGGFRLFPWQQPITVLECLFLSPGQIYLFTCLSMTCTAERRPKRQQLRAVMTPQRMAPTSFHSKI
jgi:hypothetical protein